MAARTDLGKWMITNGGEYDPDATYEKLTMVMYGGSTYITMQTVHGVTPEDDRVNYMLMARGFMADVLSEITATDTSGVLGQAGASVSAQSLVDWLSNQVLNQVLKKTDLVNNALATTPGVSALDAVMGKGLQDQIDAVNSGLVPKIRSLNFTFLNSASGSAGGYYIRSGNIVLIYIDTTFNSMGNSSEKISLNNLPSLIADANLSMKLGEKAVWASISKNGTLQIWSDYGGGRYSGDAIGFLANN